MRLFELLNNIHVFIYLFPALGFILLLGLALAYSHFRSSDDDARMTEIVHTYPEEIQSRNAPFPLAMTFIIAGTVVWAFFYILFMGMFAVVI